MLLEYLLQYLLHCIEFAELGCLYDYLRKNSIDFQQILLWAKQIALG